MMPEMSSDKEQVEAPDAIEISASFTAKECRVLNSAIAGCFPPQFNEYRMPTIRKLARLAMEHEEAEAVPNA